MTKISYTALSKYIECPTAYKLHYNDKLRPIKIGSALIFGNAFDKAIIELLLTKDVEKAYNVFEKEWSISVDVAGNAIDVKTYPHIEYGYNDLDPDLLTKEELSTHPQWTSLLRKGELLITQYYTDIFPKIKEVLGTQIEIELENNDGDKVIGKCDYIIRWENDEIHAVDLKSSSVPYDRDSVKKSTQLAIYDVALKEQYKIDKCAYHVGSKHINKNKIKKCEQCAFDGSGTQFKTCPNKRNNVRCNGEWEVKLNPSAHFQVIIDNVDPLFKERTIENLNEINFAVKNKIYFRNYNSCKNKYGGLCSYFNYCHRNSLDGLVKK